MKREKSTKFRDWGRKFGIFLSDLVNAAGVLILAYAFAITGIGFFFVILWGLGELVKFLFY